METDFESTNINIEWLNNILEELKLIQDLERQSREGCRNLMEYLQIPFNQQKIIMADVQYKNMRFLALELDLLIVNLAPIIPEKVDEYSRQLNAIIKNINKRSLFLEERKVKNRVVEVYTLSFLHQTIDYLVKIKSNIIKDISSILYIKPEEIGRKKWKK